MNEKNTMLKFSDETELSILFGKLLQIVVWEHKPKEKGTVVVISAEVVRDFLLERFPVEHPTMRDAASFEYYAIDGVVLSHAQVVDAFRKAAAYDAAVEEAKRNVSCEGALPRHLELTSAAELQDRLASGAFLKEKT